MLTMLIIFWHKIQWHETYLLFTSPMFSNVRIPPLPLHSDSQFPLPYPRQSLECFPCLWIHLFKIIHIKGNIQSVQLSMSGFFHLAQCFRGLSRQ